MNSESRGAVVVRVLQYSACDEQTRIVVIDADEGAVEPQLLKQLDVPAVEAIDVLATERVHCAAYVVSFDTLVTGHICLL
jgi:hypothetical protein